MRFAVVVMLVAIAAGADTWGPRERQQIDSANGQWRLIITPEDRAHVQRRVVAGWRHVARWKIRNAAWPALIANDGTVAAFEADIERAVVIHRLNGSVVRVLNLSDLVEEEDLTWFPRSVSSVGWQGTHRIDDEKRLLIVEIDANGRFYETLIRLDTGEMLMPKRRVFPDPEVSWKANDAMGCLSPSEVTDRVIDAVRPKFPEIARRARIVGQVLVEIDIDTNGVVTSTNVLKPLPFGMDKAVVDAVIQWRFRPSGRPSCAQIVFQFGHWPTEPAARTVAVP